MRNTRLACVCVAACLLSAWHMADWRVALPRIHQPYRSWPYPGVEPLCAETMRQRPPDRSWQSPAGEAWAEDRLPPPVAISDLLVHNGRRVRVAGFLHAEFEWVALYPSRDAMKVQHWRAPWVDLHALWEEEPFWVKDGPAISDRCVLILGTYRSGDGGHYGMFDGTIDALRLDVWSTPHRPLPALPSPR